jgi:fatty-acyl-CoA synthase
MITRLRSELSYVAGLVRVVRATKLVTNRPDRTLGDHLAEWAERHGDKPALGDDRESVSYRALDARANAYARWAQSQGLAQGDAVALLMPNRPEYVAIWFGLARAGIGVALVNTNLTGSSLAHSFDVVAARAVIVDASLMSAFETARAQSKQKAPVFVYGGAGADARLDVGSFSDAPLSAAERPALTITNTALYIYTSGTTGMPKAARITHSRALRIMYGFAATIAATADDRVYMCLPMYHTNGGIIALGITLTVGGSAYIREKFSASGFWSDAVRERCTLFVYIGELCRYLLNSPESAEERAHKIRACVGNGLRPDIYETFRQRFGIRSVLEFYGSTEGNAVMVNFDFRPGAIGRIPNWAKSRFPMALIAYDVDADQHPRDAAGFCRECGAEEVGELFAEIRDDPKYPAARFDGYADPAATNAKIMRGVLKPGDAWFRTGDLMRRDAQGYFYFVDRIGDTFRWKGENVSTTQVAETISSFAGVKEAIVYGVEVTKHDGRAGMAALVVDSIAEFDIDGLRAHLEAALPVYARPLFLRFQPELEITGTFKPKKTELVAAGFDPARVDEPLYYDDRTAHAYRKLDAAIFATIVSGAIAL